MKLHLLQQDNSKESGLEFKDWEMEMYGSNTTSTIEFLKESSTFRITRSQQTLDEFPTILRLKIKSQTPRNRQGILPLECSLINSKESVMNKLLLLVLTVCFVFLFRQQMK